MLYTKVAKWSEQGKEPFDTSNIGETEILICRQTASQRWLRITTEIQKKAAGEEVGIGWKVLGLGKREMFQ